MTIAALILATLALAGVALTGLRLRAMRRPARRRNGHEFVPWDWPPRPINGHDHPDPPELEREPTA